MAAGTILVEKKVANPRDDLLSGLTVALALVPEAVAFAFVAGVAPLVGLYAAFIVAILTATLGGRPGMISGATGALAVVMVSLVQNHGVQYLFFTVVLMGIIQVSAGVLKLGKFIRLVPHPVMLGFVNGLAIVIGLAQLESFKVKDAAGVSQWMATPALITMLLLIIVTMGTIHFFPKITGKFPAPLAGILLVTAIALGFNLDTALVGDLASINGSFPSFAIPNVPFTFATLKVCLPYAFILAAIGLIESLMTMTLIDDITETRGRGNKECVGQGVANVVTGFFGGMGGCAMIGQSMINIKSGGRGRLSGISSGVFLLIIILFASSLIEQIPVAALTGVMFMVVIGTFAWPSLKILPNIPRADAFVIILVSAITVWQDLAIAVFVGVIVSALVFAWEKSKAISAVCSITDMGSKIYEIHGPLFFGSTTQFQRLFTPSEDKEDIIIDFINSRVYDHSGIEAIKSLSNKYQQAGKTLHLRHLSPECIGLLEKAGELVELNLLEDPSYHIADDDLA